MKICMLIPSFYPLIGGAERQLQSLLPLLRDRGVQPFVLTRRLPGTRARENIAGVQIIRSWTGSHPLGFVFSSLYYLVCHRNDWDLVHVHTTDSPTLVAATTRWLLGKPTVVKVRGRGAAAGLAGLQRTWKGRIRLRYVSKFVDGFVVVNKAIRDDLLALGVQERRLFAIPNGVDIHQFHVMAEDQRQHMREELDLPDAPIVTYVGRLIPLKQVRLLVHLWPALLHDVPNATLLLIGDGPERLGLEAAVRARGVQERVRFLGRREQQEVVHYLQASDCFVLCSSSEGLSNALLEAMATGLAAVVSRIEGNLEVVSDGKNGLMFSTAEELREQLVRCLTQKRLRSELGAKARQTVVEYFSMSQVASQLTALYGHLLKKPKGQVTKIL